MADYRENRDREREHTGNREKRLAYLHDLKDYKVAKEDPDVRGWKMVDANNEVIGTVDSLLVDLKEEKVRYLDIDVDESLLPEGHEPYAESDMNKPHEYKTRNDETHMIVPIGLAKLDREHHTVISNEVNREKYSQMRRVKKGEPITPDYERQTVGTLIGPSAVEGTSRNVNKNPLRTEQEDNFYNTNYFNEDSFYGRERNTVR